MKNNIKHLLSRLGLLPIIDFLRRIPEIVRWLKQGCRSTAPAPIKRWIIIKSYLKSFALKHFVETGTHTGDTLAYIAQNKEIQSVSIELDNDHYQRALIRFNAWKNVKLMNGDSGALMGDIVKSIKGPALFWLDGHYSGVGTAQGESETPVSLELSTIFQSSVLGHVILIDDIRCFDGSRDYPHLDKLLALIRDDGRWQVEISADIMRLTPKEG